MADENRPDEDQASDVQSEAEAEKASLEEAMPDVDANNSVSSEHPEPD
ncbi:hypothetical protein N7650_25925 [Pseudomonas sp. GD04058]|nr:hypothetical protein [Pseudomonas sp. GD04058]MDG9886271.1 hypothetical protein [Pseudomonas sp. GD04058]